MTRTAEISRTTQETDVRLALSLDGSGSGTRATGVGFFDHMLDALARHGRLDLDCQVRGDLDTGAHHTVEDTGLALGQALDEALGSRSEIARFGQATVPMDEARASCAIDLSGRPYTWFRAKLGHTSLGAFEPELCEEFFRAVASAGRLTVHLQAEAGTNTHHMIEALFKAFALSLRRAVTIEPGGGVPSTKGVL